MGSSLPAQNYTHENENWRQRLKKESTSAEAFMGKYDYLVKPKVEEGVETHTTSKVKYYKSAGGWTVIDKRVPGKTGGRPIHCITETQALDLLKGPALDRDATATTAMTHALVMASNENKSALHRRIAESYGQRHSLEMFGVGQHGRTATRTKEPVGNGTKIYIR